MEDVQFRAWRGEELAAVGTARTAVYVRGTGEVEASDVDVDMPRAGKPDLLVQAPSLTGDLPARTWNGKGGVTLRQGTVTAEAPSARWEPGDGLVRGDESVVVTGPGYRLAGPSFTANPETGQVDVRGGVRLVAEGSRR